MKILYIANVRMPTEKAHGVAIVKACEAFARAGVKTKLVVPMRRTPFEKDVFDTYGVEHIFSVAFLPTIDLIREHSGKAIFWLQTATFQWSLFFYLMLQSRKTILYTRDPLFVPLRLLGFTVVFECHLIPQNRRTFFFITRWASKVVVISAALKSAFVEAGFQEDAVLVAPSGVDLTIFDIDSSKENARKDLELPQEAFLAVYTGNFTTMGEDKGISDILRSLMRANDVVFAAVGGSGKDRARYSREAAELGISGRVILRGTTTQKNLAIYQKAADVLLMPFPDTPHYRNHMSPVKMFEYMAAKRPIIASDLPTIREVLDEITAIIVPPGDSSALATALENVRSNPDGSIAQKAYEKVIARYSWQKRTELVLKFIA